MRSYYVLKLLFLHLVSIFSAAFVRKILFPIWNKVYIQEESFIIIK